MAPAGAEVPRELVGTTAFEDPGPDDFARIAPAIGIYRSNLYWPAVEPERPGERDWSRYDALIGAAARHGIRVLPTIYGSPSWAAAMPHYPPDGAHRKEFAGFLEAAAARYGAAGEFWREHPGLEALPVRSWEIWNEPNNATFWLPNPNARQYERLLASAAPAIRRADPGAEVVVGGLFPTSYASGVVPMKEFLDDLYESGAATDFDAVGVHPYASDPVRAFELVGQARAIMDAHGDDAPIWVTEVGWATSGEESGVTVSDDVQARYARQTFELADRNRARLGLAGVIWFCLRDQEEPGWPNRTGLFTASGEPKAAWQELLEITRPAWIDVFVRRVRRFGEALLAAARGG